MTAGEPPKRKRGRPPKPPAPPYESTAGITREELETYAERIAYALGLEPAHPAAVDLAYVAAKFLLTKEMRHRLPRLRPRRGNRSRVDLRNLLHGCALIASEFRPLACVTPDGGKQPAAIQAWEYENQRAARDMLGAFGATAEDSYGEPVFVKFARAVLGAVDERVPGTLRYLAQEERRLVDEVAEAARERERISREFPA